jgi:hypothetical protein
MTSETAERPWYRHFWVWFLVIPPAATVIFWAVVLTTAASPPALVVDDYARIGLTYEQEQARDRRAAELGVTARLHVSRQEGGVTIALAGLDVPPDRLELRLAHPTDASLDRRSMLTRTGTGIYRGRLGGAVSGRRYVQIEPPGAAWRLGGELAAARNDLALEPAAHVAAR